MRYELNDHEWGAIKPLLPNKPRGVPCVSDRRVLNGIFWYYNLEHRGATCRTTSVVHHLLQSLRSLATSGRPGQDHEHIGRRSDTAVQMIDTSIVRVHQHGA